MKPLRNIVWLSMLLGVGIILQAIEALYLPSLIIPGAKLGLANSITLLVMIMFTWKDALLHVVVRVLTVSLITGTFLSTTFLYSLAGGLTSTLVMIIWLRYFYGAFSFAGVSLMGALTHNITQLFLSVLILGHIGIMTLLPWLIFMAIITGVPNGLMVNVLKPRLEKATAQLLNA